MKKSNKTYKRRVLLQTVLCVCVLALVSCMIFTLQECSEYFGGEVKAVAQKYTIQNANKIKNKVNKSFNEIKSIASSLSAISGTDSYDKVGKAFVKEYGVSCLQFLKDGEAEYRFGKSVGSSTSTQFKTLISNGVYGCSDIFTDMSLGIQTVSVFCPVSGNKEIDGVIAYYPVAKAIETDVTSNKLLEYYCLAKDNGSILEDYSAKGFATDSSHNIYTYLQNLGKNKDTIDKIEHNVKEKVNDTYYLTIENKKYIVSCANISSLGSNCFIVNIYENQSLINQQYPLYDRILVTAICLMLLTLIVILTQIYTTFKTRSQFIMLDEVDPVYGCNTYKKFIRQATELMAVNKTSSFAMIYLDINRFTYIKEQFGTEVSEELIKYISVVIEKTITNNETYGHVDHDRFVMMVHNTQNKELENRLRVLSVLISNFEAVKSTGYNLTIGIGVYLIERSKNYSIQEMVDRSKIASTVHKKSPNRPFFVYESSIRSEYLREAEIESRMEKAYKNKEFRVFFQPKYNIHKDCIDGAEALVRWYNPEKNVYISPGEFISLFEVNGFISKLDRNIFEQVCQYLKEAKERNEKIVPISINVSRVTAISPDFLNFYVSKKREYGIEDEFLMIEFTESFAYENYEKLDEIVSTLRKNGFRCSIDDFGSGYSSFNILKELKMDEIKLDKLFLDPGTDPEKDEFLLKTVVNLGNNFNMKVTQEGIENMEQLNKLKEFNCDVIQGYYYSKPIPMSDFIDFVNGDTSLNGVINMHLSLKKNKKTEE